MDKQGLVHAYHGILCSTETEQTAGYSHMRKSQMHLSNQWLCEDAFIKLIGLHIKKDNVYST